MRSYCKIILALFALGVAFTASAQESEFKASMKTAAEKQSAKQYSEAQSLYSLALKQAGKADEKQHAVRGIADCFNAQNKFVEASEEIKANLGVFEGADATSSAYVMIISSLSRANEFKQALEWQKKRLGIEGLSPELRAEIYLQIGDMQKEKLRQAADARKSYLEAIKIYDGIIAAPGTNDKVKSYAVFRRVLAFGRDDSCRAEYLKAADELVASSGVQLEHKISVLDQMKNVYIKEHDWNKAAECLRKYADLPDLSPSVKAGILLQLGDINWRNRRNIQDSLKALSEVCAIPEASAKTKQDAETWIIMLTERY